VLPAISNQQGGIYFDQGTYGTTNGGVKPIQANFIKNNEGDGLNIISSAKSQIIGNDVSSNTLDLYATWDCNGTIIDKNIIKNNSTANYETNRATCLIVR